MRNHNTSIFHNHTHSCFLSISKFLFLSYLIYVWTWRQDYLTAKFVFFNYVHIYYCILYFPIHNIWEKTSKKAYIAFLVQSLWAKQNNNCNVWLNYSSLNMYMYSDFVFNIYMTIMCLIKYCKSKHPSFEQELIERTKSSDRLIFSKAFLTWSTIWAN